MLSKRSLMGQFVTIRKERGMCEITSRRENGRALVKILSSDELSDLKKSMLNLESILYLIQAF